MEDTGRVERKADMITVGLALLPPEGWKMEDFCVTAVEEIWSAGGKVRLQTARVGEDPGKLRKILKRWADRERLTVACTVGRSGHRAEDFAPEITRPLLHRSLPGVEERMYLSPPRFPEDLFFRGAAGIRKETIIINFPSRRGRIRTILRFLEPVLRHAAEKAAGDESECAR